jgi:hypothetical protein
MDQINKASEKPIRKTIDLWPEAGTILGLGRNATYAAAASGQIPGAVKIGGRWIVLRSVLDRFLSGADRGSAA